MNQLLRKITQTAYIQFMKKRKERTPQQRGGSLKGSHFFPRKSNKKKE